MVTGGDPGGEQEQQETTEPPGEVCRTHITLIGTFTFNDNKSNGG